MEKNEQKKLLGRVDNPIVIRLSHLGNVILPMNGIEEETDINGNGVIIGNSKNEHYGFTIISDYNNNQHEQNYRTDNKIIAVQMSEGKLKVYEENRIHPWLFMKNGKIIENNNATVDFSHKKCDFQTNDLGHLEQNDGLIKILINTITGDVSIDANGEILPISLGCAFENEYYGINFEITRPVAGKEDETEVVKLSYLTEDSLYGIEVKTIYGNNSHISRTRDYKIDEIESINVYEREKYHPWRFSSTGELLKKSAYNPYSRRDVEAYENKYGVRMPR